jgi:hypothetical protein
LLAGLQAALGFEPGNCAASANDGRSAKSNNTGAFNFVDLNPMKYRLTAITPGFATCVSSAVTVCADEHHQLPPIILERFSYCYKP